MLVPLNYIPDFLIVYIGKILHDRFEFNHSIIYTTMNTRKKNQNLTFRRITRQRTVRRFRFCTTD